MAIKGRARRKIKQFKKRIAKIRDKKHRYAFVMDQFQRGQLYSSAGTRVKNPAQARAIAFSITHGRDKMRPRPPKPVKKPSLLRRIMGAFQRRKSRS